MSEITTIVEINDVGSPDYSVCKTEIFDVEMAKQLADNEDIIKEERLKLKRLLKSRVRGCYYDAVYKLGKHIKHDFLGRFCVLRGLGLQSLQRDIRSALAMPYYWDIDMINAQPTLLVQICENNGLACEYLKQYIQNREELLTEICETQNIERWEAKERVISILFGANPTGLLTPFFENEFYNELRKIMTNIWEKNQDIFGFLKKVPNRYGKAIAYFLQTEERKVLIALDHALAKRGRSLDVLIHDGGLVRKKENETFFPVSLLRELEADIKEKTGYVISLAVKPMRTSFEKNETTEDDYQEKKEEYEKTYFKVMSPSIFVRIVGDTLQTLSTKDLIHQLGNVMLNDGTGFVAKWIKDPTIRTYERLVYAPKKEVPDTEFNIFTGFPLDAEVGDFNEVNEVLSLISNHDVEVMNYIENYVAHIIQKPYEKTRVAIIVQGEQGAGKDTFWDFIGSLLGSSYYFSTDSPENNIFSRFNHGTEKVLLVKIEEGNYITNKANAEKFKAKIVSPIETFERKGQDTLTLPDMRNFVMTTNQDVPIPIEETDRRFMLIKASSEKLGDSVFWNRIHTALSKPELKSAYYHSLLHRDISNFNPSRDRIKTAYYQETKSVFAPTLAKYFQHHIETLLQKDDMDTYDIFAPQLKNKIHEFAQYDYTNKRLGTEINKFVEAGCITKTYTMYLTKYTIKPKEVMDFMKEKHWWVIY